MMTIIITHFIAHNVKLHFPNKSHRETIDRL